MGSNWPDIKAAALDKVCREISMSGHICEETKDDG